MEYTDIERRILDLWPKFEDGCYVQLGDKAVANSGENSGKEFTVRNIYFENGRGRLRSSTLDGCYWNWKAADPYVKRPAPKVLDADGVEIHLGDTVYEPRMFGDNSFTVSRFTKNRDGKTFVMVEEMGGGLFPETVTHIRPDSWERLEKDATMSAWSYRDKYGLAVGVSNDKYIPTTVAFALDLVRRAKALAEKEAAR